MLSSLLWTGFHALSRTSEIFICIDFLIKMFFAAFKMGYLTALTLHTVLYALLSTRIDNAAMPNAVFDEHAQYNQTIDLSSILKRYVGKCYAFATTMMYEMKGCQPVYKRNMICAGTCQSSVYPKVGGFKEYCRACQARRLIWERIKFLCPNNKEQKVTFAWIQIVDGCQCNEVSCGINADDIV